MQKPVPAQPLSLVRATVASGRIYVIAPFSFGERCKSIPGARWNDVGALRGWMYYATPALAQRIFEEFKPDRIRFDEAFRDLLVAQHDVETAQYAKTATDEGLPPIPLTNTQPWLHQLRAFWFAYKLRAVMLMMGMGTGKSKVVVDLVINRGHMLTIIVAPKAVVPVWAKQFRVHGGKPVLVVALPTSGGATVEDKKRIIQAAIRRANDQKVPLVIVGNYDAMRLEPLKSYLLRLHIGFLVMDESHKLKAPGGKRALMLAELGDRSEYRMALTGTPMPHDPSDIYAQYRALDRGIFGTNADAFKSKYCVMGGYQLRSVVDLQPQYKDEFYDKMMSIAFEVGRDALDLPPEHHIIREATLSARGWKLYAEIEEEFYAWLEEAQEEVTVENILVKLLRLGQITSGYLRSDNKVDVEVDTAKRDLLEDTLDDLPVREPVVVFCHYQHDLDVMKAIAAKQHRRYGELSGRRNDLTKDSTMPENVDVFAVQIQSGGAGIDLTRAHYAIYYSVDFSLDNFDQSIARLCRPGQMADRVIYIHLLIGNSIDVDMYHALDARRDLVEGIRNMRNAGYKPKAILAYMKERRGIVRDFIRTNKEQKSVVVR